MLSRNMGHKHYAVWNDTMLTFPEGEWYKVGFCIFFLYFVIFFLNITCIRALTMVKGRLSRSEYSCVWRHSCKCDKGEIGLVIDVSPSAV